MFPPAGRIPVVGNPGGRAATSARQRDDPPVVPEQPGERASAGGQFFSAGMGRDVQWVRVAACAPGLAPAARFDSAILSCIWRRASRWYSTGRAVAR